MRIVLDLQGAQSNSRFRGIGRYSLALAKAIARHRREHEVTVALSALFPDTIEPISQALHGLLPDNCIRVWDAPRPVREARPSNDWRRLAAEQVREAFIASLQPDVVHVSSMLEGFGDDVVTSIGPLSAPLVTVVTLYDLIPLMNRASFLDPFPGFERHYLRKLEHLSRADGVLAISESAAREGREVLGLEPDAVVNISAACDPMFHPADLSPFEMADARARLGRQRPFILFAGGADITKNLHRLIQAYAALAPRLRLAHQLVLVGTMTPSQIRGLRRVAEAADLSASDVVLPGFVEDGDLVLLYRLCKLFVLPSTHEGFGLPALEAMASGAPVIGSRLSSVPEVIGWERALFDPLDVSDMTNKMSEALVEGGFRSELIRRGPEQASRFSWDATGRRAVTAFERFHHERSAAKPPRILDRGARVDFLIEMIQQVGVGRPSDQDLLHTARAIDLNNARAD